jgi:hypothetical protein
MRSLWLSAALALASTTGTSQIADAAPDEPFALLRGVNVVSMTDGSVAPNREILVRGDKIVAVLPDVGASPVRAREIRLNGAFVTRLYRLACAFADRRHLPRLRLQCMLCFLQKNLMKNDLSRQNVTFSPSAWLKISI